MTPIIHKFTNLEHGVEGRVVLLNNGKFSATLYDLDAEATVGVAYIYLNEADAIAKAKSISK